MNQANQLCSRCGAEKSLHDENALCPVCLLTASLNWINHATSETASVVNNVCGGYLLEKIIGRGGSGVVYLAHKSKSATPVALKMLALTHGSSVDDLRRFRFEIESISQLQHPNIVRVLESGEHEGFPYYVMDYAAGGTLASLLSQYFGKDATRTAVNLMIKIARAVHYAHERGVLHRDLKPGNILLDQQGEPLVSDFGLARLLHTPTNLTMTGTALGTPGYMSPEQASGTIITTATDIYSLGAILFHLLVGRPPFVGDSTMEILRQVIANDAPDPSSLAPWIDRDLAIICLTALRREPIKRYATSAAFADDLERWQQGETVLARPLAWYEFCGKWLQRHPIAASIFITSAVAALALISLYVAGSVMLREERNFAREQEIIAKENARTAEKARDDFQLNSYAADISLGYRSLADGHLGLSRQMLTRHRHEAGNKDLRGFEWHALNSLCMGDDVFSDKKHTAAVTAIAFHPQGDKFVSGGRDRKIYLRSVPDGKILLELPNATAPRDVDEIPLITAVTAQSAEMRSLILSGKINPDELRMRGRPSALGEIFCLAWSTTGQQLLSAGPGNYVRLWAMPEGRLEGLIPVVDAVDASYSIDRKHLLIFARQPEQPDRFEVRCYDSQNFSIQRVIGNCQEAHAFSPDGTRFTIMNVGSNKIYHYDTSTGNLLSSWENPLSIKKIAYSTDGKMLFGVEKSGAIIAQWQLSDGQRIGSVFPIAGAFDNIMATPDGDHMISTGAAQMISYQSITASSPARLLRGHEDKIHALALSSDGQWLASAGNDCSVRLWSLKQPVATTSSAITFPPIPQNTDHELTVTSQQGEWSGDGMRLGVIRLRDSSSGKVIQSITGPPERYSRLLAGPNNTLVAFSWPRVIRIRKNGQWSESIKLSTGTIGPIVFSPDGQWIASGGDDNVISVHHADSGNFFYALRGHQARISSLAFTPDSRTLASSADDATVRLWHVATWRDLGVLHQGEKCHSLRFSLQGEFLRCVTESGENRDFGKKNQ